jgi:hypothetical protein
MTKLAPMIFYILNIPQLVSNIYNKVLTFPICFLVFPSKEFLTRLHMIQYNRFCQGVIYFVYAIRLRVHRLFLFYLCQEEKCFLSCATFTKHPNVQRRFI